MRRRTYDNSIYGDLFEYTDDEKKLLTHTLELVIKE